MNVALKTCKINVKILSESLKHKKFQQTEIIEFFNKIFWTGKTHFWLYIAFINTIIIVDSRIHCIVKIHANVKMKNISVQSCELFIVSYLFTCKYKCMTWLK